MATKPQKGIFLTHDMFLKKKFMVLYL